jgi:hypothetical protein
MVGGRSERSGHIRIDLSADTYRARPYLCADVEAPVTES